MQSKAETEVKKHLKQYRAQQRPKNTKKKNEQGLWLRQEENDKEEKI